MEQIAGKWAGAAKAKVAGRRIQIVEPGARYDAWPAADEILRALTRVRDNDARAIAFVESYGLLAHPTAAGEAEDLESIRATAAELRDLASLVISLRESQAAETRDGAIRDLRKWAKGPGTKATPKELLASAQDYVSKGISNRTERVGYRLVPNGDRADLFLRVPRATTLLDVLYARLAEWIHGGRAIAQCSNRECHAVFQRDDARERFCSPACRNREYYLATRTPRGRKETGR